MSSVAAPFDASNIWHPLEDLRCLCVGTATPGSKERKDKGEVESKGHLHITFSIALHSACLVLPFAMKILHLSREASRMLQRQDEMPASFYKYRAGAAS